MPVSLTAIQWPAPCDKLRIEMLIGDQQRQKTSYFGTGKRVMPWQRAFSVAVCLPARQACGASAGLPARLLPPWPLGWPFSQGELLQACVKPAPCVSKQDCRMHTSTIQVQSSEQLDPYRRNPSKVPLRMPAPWRLTCQIL